MINGDVAVTPSVNVNTLRQLVCAVCDRYTNVTDLTSVNLPESDDSVLVCDDCINGEPVRESE